MIDLVNVHSEKQFKLAGNSNTNCHVDAKIRPSDFLFILLSLSPLIMLIDFNGIFTRNADKSAHKILVTIADDDDCHRRFTSLFQIFDFFFPFWTPPKLHGTTDDTPDEFLLILKRTTISCNPPSKYKVMLTLSYQFTEGLQKKAVNTTPTITNHIDFN